MMIKTRSQQRNNGSSFNKTRAKVKSRKNSKRYRNDAKSTNVLGSGIKSIDENISDNEESKLENKYQLELVSLDGKKHVLNIVDNSTFNFPNIQECKVPNTLKSESTVLQPVQKNFNNLPYQLMSKKSGDTHFIIDSPIKDPRYFLKHH